MWFEWLLWELGVLPALSPPLVLRGARKVEKPILTEALPWPGTGGAQWGQGGERAEDGGSAPLASCAITLSSCAEASPGKASHTLHQSGISSAIKSGEDDSRN